MFRSEAKRLAFLLESMEYAKRIQDALTPSLSVMATLPPHYVLNLPKDVVSGDFYYYHRDRFHVIIVADATGHGTSAAILSAMAHTSLKSITEGGTTSPHMILNMMDRRMYEILSADNPPEKRISDSIDVGCLRINDSLTEAVFCGANRPLWTCRNGEFKVYEKERMSIGGDGTAQDKEFKDHRVQLKPGDNLYMFSDGMADQFGGPNDKRLMSKGVREILLASQELPIEHRRGFVIRKFNDWRLAREQVDDVLLLAIEIPEAK